ncbi:DivIVA domain-containing protein [Syntrophomonas palmitatica]|uniref:DivIVA domain-containing protein n=1 Tax=Syntrophomonas palmitatica TaxID=402877 RepID=UPI0006CF4431|nr:DivIVA domain-containing protein [Syntrophomonas palmitatica]
MITAVEIRNQQFGKSLRGYDSNEVNNFLLQVAQDYEKLYSENATLRDNMQRLEYELQKYRKLEETMNNSLILAQQTAEDVKSNARREAAIIMEESKRRIAEVFSLYQDLIKRLGVFSADLKGQLLGQMEIVEKNQRKMEELSAFFFSKDLKELMEKLEASTVGEQCSE